MRTIVGTAFFRFFVCSARFYLKAWILYQRVKKYALKSWFFARGAPRKHSAGLFAIFAGAQCQYHVVWLHVVFVVLFAAKIYAHSLARGAAARFYLCFLRVFLFPVPFAFYFLFHPSIRPSFHPSIVPSLSFSFLSFRLLLAFPTFPTFLLISEIINNIYINTYFVCVCAYIRARAHDKGAAK